MLVEFVTRMVVINGKTTRGYGLTHHLSAARVDCAYPHSSDRRMIVALQQKDRKVSRQNRHAVVRLAARHGFAILAAQLELQQDWALARRPSL